MAIDTPPVYSGIQYNSAFFPDANDTGLTQTIADGRYLSKLFDSVANGIISFVLGLKTNRITFYTGSTITIGTVDSTATNIYKPILSSTAPANNANNTSIISTAWVNSFWTYVRTQAYSWSGIQTFTEISSSTTTLNGDLTINNTGTLTLNKPISSGYTYGANGSTGIGKIGEVVSATYSAVTFFPTGTVFSVGMLPNLAQGLWILTGNVYTQIGSIALVQTVWENTTTGSTHAIQQFGGQIGSNNFGITNTTTIYLAQTSTVNLNVYFSYSGGSGNAPSTINNSYQVQAIRIG